MCSGARSSSANGAIAARAAAACSWSTSSSTVLSDCTIKGPSVIPSIIQKRRTTVVSARGNRSPVRRKTGLDLAGELVTEDFDQTDFDTVERWGGNLSRSALRAVDVGDHVGVHVADV